MLGVPFGRLPGDFAVKRGNFSFYFPLATSIILSILLTLLFAFSGADDARSTFRVQRSKCRAVVTRVVKPVDDDVRST